VRTRRGRVRDGKGDAVPKGDANAHRRAVSGDKVQNTNLPEKGAKVNDKAQIITTLREVFNRWEALSTGINEEQITASNLIANRSIKGIVAHLRAWQQVSIARLEAALLDREPEFPKWLAGLDPESEDNRDKYNDWIYQAYREQPWSSVQRVWKEGFLRFLELAEAIPEKDLFDIGRYSWLKEYSLSAVLLGSYEHHEEHLEPLMVLLRQNGKL
jgi:hypothetical protein